MKAPLGYDFIDGKLVVNEDEAKIVKYVFEKQKEYTDHPPKELVDRVLEIAQERGEVLTYEEAEQRVSYSDILIYLTKEMNSKPEFLEILKKEPSLFSGELRNNEVERSKPIISQEVWNEVQDKLKSQK